MYRANPSSYHTIVQQTIRSPDLDAEGWLSIYLTLYIYIILFLHNFKHMLKTGRVVHNHGNHRYSIKYAYQNIRPCPAYIIHVIHNTNNYHCPYYGNPQLASAQINHCLNLSHSKRMSVSYTSCGHCEPSLPYNIPGTLLLHIYHIHTRQCQLFCSLLHHHSCILY